MIWSIFRVICIGRKRYNVSPCNWKQAQGETLDPHRQSSKHSRALPKIQLVRNHLQRENNIQLAITSFKSKTKLLITTIHKKEEKCDVTKIQICEIWERKEFKKKQRTWWNMFTCQNELACSRLSDSRDEGWRVGERDAKIWARDLEKGGGSGKKRSLCVSGKLSTYPSLKPTLTLTFHLGQNVGFGEG